MTHTNYMHTTSYREAHRLAAKQLLEKGHVILFAICEKRGIIGSTEPTEVLAIPAIGQSVTYCVGIVDEPKTTPHPHAFLIELWLQDKAEAFAINHSGKIDHSSPLHCPTFHALSRYHVQFTGV